MLAKQRFRLYRWLLGTFMAKGFKDQEVLPLAIPTEDDIKVEVLSPDFPRLFGPKNFPKSEHADARYKGIRLRQRLLPLVAKLPASTTAPGATDLGEFLREVYPKKYQKIWPTPPAVPPEFESHDVLAALAVSGPFAMYLQAASTVADIDARSHSTAGPKDYVIDMTSFAGYGSKPGLVPPGGLAVFAVDGDHLRTRCVVYQGTPHDPVQPTFERASKAFLCAMNTHLTTLVHNVTYHLAYVTPMAVATTNEFDTDHPVRRLLHPALHTTLIGNYEVAKFQVVGAGSFATKLFSYDYPILVQMINDHLEDFKVADLDPEVALERNGLLTVPIALPYWEDMMAIWAITRDYAEQYVDHFYEDDPAVAADVEIQRWAKRLHELLPSGLYDDNGYLTSGRPLDRASLARLCATFLHTSSAAHDAVNNAVWDYSTLSYLVPTVVPESLEPQDVRLSFDLLNTIMGTWKPYNMLVDGISAVALDETARAIMDSYMAKLTARQAVMDADPYRSSRTYPNELNPSVSN